MKTASSVLALALLAALTMPSSVSAGASVPCTTAELEHIAKTAEAQGGIIHACQMDTGFKLYPFEELPTDGDQQRHVCSGRSCPTAISNLQEAKLPDCLMALRGDSKQQATPAEFLKSLCTVNTTPAPSSTDGSGDDDDGDDAESSSSGSGHGGDADDGNDLNEDAMED
ncbi:Elicitin [Globisporangium polare]